MSDLHPCSVPGCIVLVPPVSATCSVHTVVADPVVPRAAREAGAHELWRIGNERIGHRDWGAVAEHYLAEAEACIRAALSSRSLYTAEEYEALAAESRLLYKSVCRMRAERDRGCSMAARALDAIRVHFEPRLFAAVQVLLEHGLHAEFEQHARTIKPAPLLSARETPGQ